MAELRVLRPLWNWTVGTGRILHIRKDDGVHINWPRFGRRKKKDKKKYGEYVSELVRFFENALAYSKVVNPKEKDLKLEAIRGVFSGKKSVYINVQDVGQVIDAIESMKRLGVKKIVIIGGSDLLQAVDLLKKHDIPVMIRRVHSLPETQDQDIDAPYKLAALLQSKGILFCLQNSGDMEAYEY